MLALGSPLHQVQAAPSDPMPPARVLVVADALDLLLALDEPGPGVVAVDVIEIDGALVATITRVARGHGSQDLVMFRTTYVFPSTIYAHAAGSNGFEASELD
jgi:hypothetical protein